MSQVRTEFEVVTEFWRLMATNDFVAVGSVLSDAFVLEWPQSGERIRGRDCFAKMNADYPAAGIWTFQVNRIVAERGHAATEVVVSDGARSDTALSFFEISDGRIDRIVEYWPEPFEPAEWRRHLVERISST